MVAVVVDAVAAEYRLPGTRQLHQPKRGHELQKPKTVTKCETHVRRRPPSSIRLRGTAAAAATATAADVSCKTVQWETVSSRGNHNTHTFTFFDKRTPINKLCSYQYRYQYNSYYYYCCCCCWATIRLESREEKWGKGTFWSRFSLDRCCRLGKCVRVRE